METDAARRRAQFELERQLRRRILDSSKQERSEVAAQVYEELFSKFPDHSAFQVTPEQRRRIGWKQAGMINPLTKPGSHILGVGCGRGDVLEALADMGCTCVGLEPSRHMIEICRQSARFEMVWGTADRLDFPDETFDVVFSQQVIEHLHPEDVPDHFAESFRVLRSGGVLSVETPNRRTGPQDVSRGFVPEAEGLHLKEWFVGELIREFRQAGFVRVGGVLAPPVLARRSRLLFRMTTVPAVVKQAQDYLLALAPKGKCRTLAGKLLGLDDIYLFGFKP